VSVSLLRDCTALVILVAQLGRPWVAHSGRPLTVRSSVVMGFAAVGTVVFMILRGGAGPAVVASNLRVLARAGPRHHTPCGCRSSLATRSRRSPIHAHTKITRLESCRAQISESGTRTKHGRFADFAAVRYECGVA
jgi:hypothetical protein